jgi:indole-3-glycerol phosphate synthase
MVVQTVPGVLARIVEHKRIELAERRWRTSLLEREAERRSGARRDFAAALTTIAPAIIAEIKKASPSKGILMDEFDPIRIARAYNRGGAAAVSVLTDSKFFQGSLADLEAVRQEVKTPVLRKDFTLDEFHVIEAAAHGADAILLIVAILDPDALRRLREAAERYRMAVLVEVHDEAELKKAVDSGARIIGVNNRNLIDFSVSLATCERLAPMIPPGTIRVAESGIHSSADIQRLQRFGYQGFLVGEHLMTSPSPEKALQALRGLA